MEFVERRRAVKAEYLWAFFEGVCIGYTVMGCVRCVLEHFLRGWRRAGEK